MKKLIPALAILGSAVAFAIYKLKKDEQKQLVDLDQDLLVDDNEEEEIIHLKPKHVESPIKAEPFRPEVAQKVQKPQPAPEIKTFVTPELKKETPIAPVLEAVKPNETVYHEEKLAEALRSLKEEVEVPHTNNDIRQAIQDAIDETKEEPQVEEVFEEKTEKLEESPFSYTAPQEEVEEEEIEEEEYNEDYPHLTNTLVDDINQMTQEAMDSLEEDGDVHEHERPVQHMVSFATMDDLDSFKNKVINKGFVITKGEGDKDLVVLHISPIDKVKLVSNILYLADQAYAYNGEYKGWQSKVSY